MVSTQFLHKNCFAFLPILMFLRGTMHAYAKMVAAIMTSINDFDMIMMASRDKSTSFDNLSRRTTLRHSCCCLIIMCSSPPMMSYAMETSLQVAEDHYLHSRLPMDACLCCRLLQCCRQWCIANGFPHCAVPVKARRSTCSSHIK